MKTQTPCYAKDSTSNAYAVAPPRISDSIAGALRTAFGRQPDNKDGADDWSTLLGRIDKADSLNNSDSNAAPA